MLAANLDQLTVEILFLALIPMGNTQIPIVIPTIRLGYDNYDLWPPSLTFIDPFSSRSAPAPLTEAWLPSEDGRTRNVLMTNADGKQFLCVPGTREYHAHPDHDGDRWELYRDDKRGSIAVICDRVWSTMTSAIAGVVVQMQPGLMTPPQVPLERAQEAARQARAAYEANIGAYAAEREARESQG